MPVTNSNSAPITRTLVQHPLGEETKSASKPKRNNSTRARPAKSALKVFQDALPPTPSKEAGSVRAKKVLQPSATNTLPQTIIKEETAKKAGEKTETTEVIKPSSTPAKARAVATPQITEGKENPEVQQSESLSRILAQRLLASASQPQDATPIKNSIAPSQDSSMFATPPQPISYTDLLTPLLSRSKIPTLKPISNVADLFLPFDVSPLALTQAYVNSLNAISPSTTYQQSLLVPDGYAQVPQQDMCPPATNVSTHRLDRSPRAKMRYSPSKQHWFEVDEETGSPRVAKEEIVIASPGSPTRRGAPVTPLKMTGLHLLEKKMGRRDTDVRLAQHVELGRGFPSPLGRGSKLATPSKALMNEEKKDLDDVRRLREASLEFDSVRSVSTPMSSKAKYVNAPSWDLFEAASQPSPAKPAEATIPISGFAAFLAKTRVVSEPLMHTATTDDENGLNSPQSLSSRRRSKRKKAKLPVPEPESDPLSWDALQQKFVETQVPEEYEHIRESYAKKAEELEAEPATMTSKETAVEAEGPFTNDATCEAVLDQSS